MRAQKETKAATPAVSPELLKQMVHALSQMRFGQLTLIVQDGKVIQLEKTEKIRLTGAGSNESCTS